MKRKQTEHTEESEKKKPRTSPPQASKGKVWKYVCPDCQKPNTLVVDVCTGCGTALGDEHLKEVSANIFLDLARGEDIGVNVHFKNEDVIVFDDVFGVSSLAHILIISVKAIVDITNLTDEDLPLILDMYDKGIIVLKKILGENPMWNDLKLPLEEYVTAGFNYPISVPQLHLHMAVPPYKHSQVWTYPRWHSYQKVVNDLASLGRVKTYAEMSDDAEGKAVYEKAMKDHNTIKVLIDSRTTQDMSSLTDAKNDTCHNDDSCIMKKNELDGDVSNTTPPSTAITHHFRESFDKWYNHPDHKNSPLGLVEVEENRLVMSHGNIAFNLFCPDEKDPESTYFLEMKDQSSSEKEPTWIGEVNSAIITREGFTFVDILNLIFYYLQENKKPLLLRDGSSNLSGYFLKNSCGSQDDLAASLYTRDWAECPPTEFSKCVLEEISSARKSLGEGNIHSFNESNVSLVIDISNVLPPSLALSLDLLLVPCSVEFDFEASFYGEKGNYPIPRFKCSQSVTTSDNLFGVTFHLKEIVARYLEDNWKWFKKRDVVGMNSFVEDKGQNKPKQEKKKLQTCKTRNKDSQETDTIK
eukprot:TRINITY_DN3287_c0_g3_i2.p1 TRINITY_DN3287_c0_g3~~TRINITY_DN3287_c0_g3_i2.p1  ORF type:complete len:582 (-),score=102.23 TRINITY_DN3287_c0_g3_i2:56-1801(-)